MLQAVCLCAAWCRSCEAFAPLFAAESPGGHWLDIEDEAALLGELDIETFPSLLLFDEGALYFYGALRPDAASLRRLLQMARQQAAAGAPGLADPSPPLRALLERLRTEAPRTPA